MATKSAPRRQYGTGAVTQECTPKCPPAVEVVGDDGKTRRARPPHPCPGRWVGSIEAGITAKGTRRRVKVTGRTQAEAKAKLKEKQRQIAAEGLPTSGATVRATVKSWAASWLETCEATLRPKTVASYASLVRQWVLPTIGHRRLDALTPADVRAVTAAIAKAGRSAATAQRAQVVLTKMLRDAIAEGYQVPQRVLLVPTPAAGENDREAIEPRDALALLKAATALPDGSRWVAALLQGMRQGECLGLTWDCVDLDGGTLDISWQLQALPYKVRYDTSSGFRVPVGYKAVQLDGALHLVRPKSKSGTRIIPLVPWMTAALTRWRTEAPTSPHGLVWPTEDGRPRLSVDDRAAWWALQDTAQVASVDAWHRPGVETDERGPVLSGRRYLLHEARHTTATLLLEAGVSESVRIAIMGHSNISITRGYEHVSQTLARRALDDVAARLGLTAA